MAKTGKPWISQYPRRKDGGFQNGTLRSQIRKAKIACDKAEYNAANIAFENMDDMFEQLQHAMSELQEATDMFAEMYNIDRDMAKANYIKANADQFVNPDVFLEPDQKAYEFINSACADIIAEQKKTSQS